MKPITFVLVVLSCSFNSVLAQNDSLITVLENTINTQIQVLGDHHLDIAMSYDSLGLMYVKASKYEHVDSLFHKALDIKLDKLPNNHPSIADSYHELGTISRRIGRYSDADTLLNKALHIRLEAYGENHLLLSKSYNSLGITYYLMGEYEKATAAYSNAIKITLLKKGKKDPDLAKFYNNLGLIYTETADYEKAINYFKKALNIKLEVLDEEHISVAGSYNNLATAYQYTGDYEKAIIFYDKALNIALKKLGNTHPKIAIIYDHLGILYFYLDDNEKATDFYKKALSIKLEVFGENHISVASSYQNLAIIYDEAKDFEKAITLYNKSLRISQEAIGEKHHTIATLYHNLGFVYIGTGNFKKAISLYNKSLNLRLEIFDKKHPSVTDSYVALANTYEKNGQIQIADSLWQIIIPQSMERLTSTYLFLPNKQRLKYSNTLTEMNTDFYSFAAMNGTQSTKQLAANFLLNTKSLALDYAISTNELIKKINDTTLTTQYQQLNNLNEQLADIEQLTIKERKEKGWDLFEIRDELANLSFQILQHHQLKSKLNSEFIEWRDIQNHLLPDEIVVDFIEIQEMKDSLWAYYAIVIHKDLPSPQFVRISDKKTLEVSLIVDENERPDFISDRKSRKAFYRTLWQPLEPYLNGISKVNVSPSGILHRVTFESLQDTKSEFLATQYDFHYYSSVRDMLKNKPETTIYKDIVLLGHILYDFKNKLKYEEEEVAIASVDINRNIRNGIMPLPETLNEVVEINQTSKQAGVETYLFTIDAASEDTVKYFVQQHAPSIFHFATHGIFLPPVKKESSNNLIGNSRDRLLATDNPLQRSALMLYGANETWTKGKRILNSGEDGILTAMEVTTMDLQNTDLVVLSACSSGLGNVHNTEGVFGLQRAFKLAGVNYVIASLWDVNDTATKDLMVAFYTNLLQKKQDPATALRNAKAALRNEGYEPVDWAGFILIE